MSLKSALQKVGQFVDDIATVEVQTYSGKVENIHAAAAVAVGADGNRFKAILDAAKADANIKLAFLTVLDFSGDAILFRAEDETIATAELVAAHQAAVTAGIQSRQAIIDLFKDLVGLDD